MITTSEKKTYYDIMEIGKSLGIDVVKALPYFFLHLRVVILPQAYSQKEKINVGMFG